MTIVWEAAEGSIQSLNPATMAFSMSEYPAKIIPPLNRQEND
jgi:hypothetical protein